MSKLKYFIIDENYINTIPRSVKGKKEPLFISNKGNALSIRQMQRLFYKYAKEVGIDDDRRHIHILRHTHAVQALKAGIDLRTLQQNLGHSGIDVTAIYLTLDIDVIDLAYAPGTSTPEPFGLTSFDVLECIKCFSSKLVGFDVVEVCPSYDKGQTALLAAKFVRYVIEHVFFKK